MGAEQTYDIAMHGPRTELALLTPVVLGAPKCGVFTYRGEALGENLFVKLITVPGVAEKEELQHKYFANFPFVPSLRHAIHDPNQGRSILAYQYIPGVTLQEAFTQSNRDRKPFPTAVISDAISQAFEMRKSLTDRDDISLDVPWAYSFPLQLDTLSKEENDTFLSAYSQVLDFNRAAGAVFPGFYLDRNPRNIMVDGSQIFQIDFGVIDKSSALFDLAKLMRNGTDIPISSQLPLGTIKADPEIALDFASVSPETEDAMLGLSYSLEPDKQADFDTYALFYQYAALHAHTLYLTNYSRKLRERRGNPDIVAARAIYHAGMSINQLNRLKDMGQQVDNLFPWIETFIDQADQNIPRHE